MLELKCPQCHGKFDYCDCPDLYWEEEEPEYKKQEKLLIELQKLGYNIVTCGGCGCVFIHRIKE